MYSADFRARVMIYLNTHTYKETQATFEISETAIKGWKKLLNETGSLERRPHNKAVTRYDNDKLLAYIKENPFADLKEIAKEFGGSVSGASEALVRLEVSQKKRQLAILNEMKQKEPNSTLTLLKLMRKQL
jgi:transposase